MSRPEAVPFAPGSGELPPPLGSALTDPGISLLLVVAPDNGDATLRTVIGLADARAIGGRQTVLVDAAFGDPRLHQLLDVPNVEGLADVFEFGASFSRVMTRPETRRFEFIPAGAYAPEPVALMSSPRWERLADDLATEGAAMLVFTTVSSPGVTELSQRAHHAVLVGDRRGVDRMADRLDPSCEVVAVVEPVSAMAPERLAAEAGEPGEMDTTIFDDPELTEPVVFRSDRKRGGVSPLLWVLLVVVLGAGGWYGYQEYLAPAPALPVPAPAAAPTEPQPEPEPVETPLGFSVAVEAHQDLDAAQDRLARLRNAMPDVGFYLAPVSVNGSLFYRVLAGPVADQDAGMRLMRVLVDRGHKTAFDNWAVRPTRLAFLLGEYDTRQEAQTKIDTLAGRGIPSYAVMIRYQPGAPRYRVYGGAFENPAAAVVMDQMLTEAGLDPRLVERVGEPVTVEP